MNSGTDVGMKRLWWLFGVVLLTACSKEPEPAAPPPLAVQHFDPASLTRGAQLYSEHCAQCHGPRGEGHPDWQTPSDGKFSAAPPLNGTGNDWKRTRPELAAVIRSGVRRKSDNLEVMPPWKGRIGDQGIEDVVNWMQSLWPAEVYNAWTKTQVAAPVPKG